MRTSLNLSLKEKTWKQVEEMKKKGTKPSFAFEKMMDEYEKNDFELPITIPKPDSVI